MELLLVNQNHKEIETIPSIALINQSNNKHIQNPFIEANTKQVSLKCLRDDCVIPVFAKDNEKTIAHQEFIEIAQSTVKSIFPGHQIDLPEIRVSHQIKGRVPSAIHKSVKELLDEDRTQYFERMAFIIKVPSITETINGNDLSLTVGGVRAYNNENLYSKKSPEKFKFFIGFQNRVCCNLCISTDGFSSSVRVNNTMELKTQIGELCRRFDPQRMLQGLQLLQSLQLTENQFAQLIGKTRLYQHLPKIQKDELPDFQFNDSQMNFIARDYYDSESFCKNSGGDINLWNVYNLFTSASKSSYIDGFLDRNTNAFIFTNSIAESLNRNSKSHWFLN